jgi:hypothetical protein
MICYRDMTFCSAKCGNPACGRNYTEEVHAAAQEWWKGFKSDHAAPIAASDFKDSDICPGHIPVVEPE